MDINMPKLSGLEAMKIIKEKHPEIIILALTVHSEDEYIWRFTGRSRRLSG